MNWEDSSENNSCEVCWQVRMETKYCNIIFPSLTRTWTVQEYDFLENDVMHLHNNNNKIALSGNFSTNCSSDLANFMSISLLRRHCTRLSILAYPTLSKSLMKESVNKIMSLSPVISKISFFRLYYHHPMI